MLDEFMKNPHTPTTMKTLYFFIFVSATWLVSCQTSVVPNALGAGYSENDAYQLGMQDGVRDAKSPNSGYLPKIDDKHRVPSFYREEYLNGYAYGFNNPHKTHTSGSK